MNKYWMEGTIFKKTKAILEAEMNYSFRKGMWSKESWADYSILHLQQKFEMRNMAMFHFVYKGDN